MNSQYARTIGEKWGKSLFEEARDRMEDEARIAVVEHGLTLDTHEGDEFEDAYVEGALIGLVNVLKEYGYGQ